MILLIKIAPVLLRVISEFLLSNVKSSIKGEIHFCNSIGKISDPAIHNQRKKFPQVSGFDCNISRDF